MTKRPLLPDDSLPSGRLDPGTLLRLAWSEKWRILLLSVIGMLLSLAIVYLFLKSRKAEAALIMNPNLAKTEWQVLSSRDFLIRSLIKRPDICVSYGDGSLGDAYGRTPFKVRFRTTPSKLIGKKVELHFLSSAIFQLTVGEEGEVINGSLDNPLRIMGEALSIVSVPFKTPPKEGDQYSFTVLNPRRFFSQHRPNLKVLHEKAKPGRIKFAYRDQHPPQGKQWLGSMIATYSEDYVRQRQDTLKNMLRDVEKEIRNLEDGASWEPENFEPEFQALWASFLERSRDFRGKLIALEIQKDLTHERLELLEALLQDQSFNLEVHRTRFAEHIQTPSDSALLQKLEEEAELRINFSESDAAAENLKKQGEVLQELKATIRQLITRQIQAERLSQRVLRRQIRTEEQEFDRFLKREKQLLNPVFSGNLEEKRSWQISEIFARLINRRIILKGKIASLQPNFQVLESPHYTPYPLRNDWLKYALLGFMLGFVAPLGFVFLKALLSRKVLSLQELAYLPTAKKIGPFSMENSGLFRGLSGWLVMQEADRGKLVNFSRFDPENETEELVVQVAAELRKLGRKVFLTGMLSPDPKDSERLAIEANTEEGFARWLSKDYAELLETKKAEYDFIFLLNLPAKQYFEAKLFEQKADLHVFSFRKNQSSREGIIYARNLLNESRKKALALFLAPS